MLIRKGPWLNKISPQIHNEPPFLPSLVVSVGMHNYRPVFFSVQPYFAFMSLLVRNWTILCGLCFGKNSDIFPFVFFDCLPGNSCAFLVSRRKAGDKED